MVHSVSFVAGLPGQGMHLAADPLSLCFVVLLIPPLTARALATGGRCPSFWAGVAGMALTVLAGDAFTLIFGFALMGVAAWLPLLRRDARAAAVYIGIVTLSLAGLVPAVFLPAGPLAFCLVLAAAALAGLAPLLRWRGAHAAPPDSEAAIMSGGMAMVAFYVLIRYAFVVMGMAAAPWWGGVLVALGAGGALWGAARACLAADLMAVLANAALAQVGLIAAGLGIALGARVLGATSLGALALQAALLGALAQALTMPLLWLGAGGVKQATGTTRLDSLGGLMRGMPRLGALMLAGAAGLAALPPGPGFAPEFLLLHAGFGAAAIGGVVGRIGFTVAVAALGLSAAFAGFAALRVIGTGFLGRPRGLHAAAAAEASPRTLAAMAGLALGALALSLAPGMILAALTPVIAELMPGATPFPLAYAPLPLAALLGLAAAFAGVALRRLSPRGVREVPAWTGGFGAAPAWLPFGDPLTQPSATGFAAPLGRALGGMVAPNAALDGPLTRMKLARMKLARGGQRVWRRRERRVTIRARLGVVLAALALFLLAIGLGPGG